MPSPRFCRQCGAELSTAARFCGRCGTATADAQRAARTRAERRSIRAIPIVYVGVLVLLFVSSFFDDLGEGAHLLVVHAGLLLIGWLGLRQLRPLSFRATLGGLPTPTDFAFGLVLGGVMVGISIAYLKVVLMLAGASADPGDESLRSTATLLAVVVGAPLVEEWLCRGVLWRAVRPHTSVVATIVVTALLFSLLHGLGSAGVFGLPNRFAGGLILGWLRARSQSLLPCVAAHAVNNSLAVWWV